MQSRRVQTLVWPAPVRGLVRAGTRVGAQPDAADVMENFIPTAVGCRLRGGTQLWGTVGSDPVKRLIVYRSGIAQSLFAATDSAVYDVTSPADPETPPTAEFDSQTSGEWSSVQFATPGGDFLVMVNGEDDMRRFDGTWEVVNDSSTPAITGVETADLNFVWSHKRRLWFAENKQLSAWYLPTNSIAGQATEFPLQGVFQRGGSLLFGGSWSRDSGDGMDDLQVFVTTEGEVAIYQGIDPSSASTWSLVGIFQIGKPVNKHGWFRAGGDLMIVTEDGIISLGEALDRDRAALLTSSITAPIEEIWRDRVAGAVGAPGYPQVLWPSQTLYIIRVPSRDGLPRSLVANTRTGAWGEITGWDVRSLSVFNDRLYFGTPNGEVYLADVGGTDSGQPYVGLIVPNFQEAGTPDNKIALHCRAVWTANTNVQVRMRAFANYVSEGIQSPSPSEFSASGTWGAGAIWGDGAIWGAGGVTALKGTDWQAVAAQGFSLSAGLAVASNSVASLNFELHSMQLRYEVARAL